MIMEARSLKLTFNVQNEFVTETLFKVISKVLFLDKQDDLTAVQLATKISKTLNDYKGLIKDFMSSKNEQEVLLEETEIFCSKNEGFRNQFHVMLQCMYKVDLVSDVVIVRWGNRAEESVKNYDLKVLTKNKA